MKNLYKSFITLISKLPKDPTKEGKRCFPTFLRQEVKRIFHEVEHENKAIDKNLCRLRLKALEKIHNNVYREAFPHNYKSGVFGAPLKYLESVNSSQGRKALGLEKKPSFWQRITGKKVE
uniref:Uncharacterized protein n=1 Tax=Strongyloides venezuelensis TaxID=75913 RepID=A0A0K0FYL6_STRVS